MVGPLVGVAVTVTFANGDVPVSPVEVLVTL